MADLPKFCVRLGCKTPKIILIKEDPEYWYIQCHSCGACQVLAKPKTAARARYENEMRRLDKPRHSWEKKRIYFT